MYTYPTVTVALALLVRHVAAWGALGHQTVGFVAQAVSNLCGRDKYIN
jgi:hypothetical protein